jgi:hypothetical protein
MQPVGLLESLGGRDYVILFSLLSVSAAVVFWCLASAFTGPIEHLTCPLLSLF